MNLKVDLVNKLGNDKYFTEVELVRVANDNNMPYKEKVDRVSELLKELASIDLANQLVGRYFQEPQQPQVETKQMNTNHPEQPKQPQPGQSHGE